MRARYRVALCAGDGTALREMDVEAEAPSLAIGEAIRSWRVVGGFVVVRGRRAGLETQVDPGHAGAYFRVKEIEHGTD